MATPINQSVIKAFAMLKCFDSPDQWLTSSELSRRAGLPEASGYRMIQTLQEVGAVVRGPRGRYRPGMLLVTLSQNVIVPELLYEASKTLAADLAERMNVTVHLGILEDGMVTYVTRATTPDSFQPHTRMGCQLEAYCTGLGKILLAELPQDQLERVLHDGELVRLTPHTITSRLHLREKLRDVRAQGFALDERETREDMSCIAVPIRDLHGRVIAALSATEHAPKMTAERHAALLPALVACAAAITRTVYPGAGSDGAEAAGERCAAGSPERPQAA